MLATSTDHFAHEVSPVCEPEPDVAGHHFYHHTHTFDDGYPRSMYVRNYISYDQNQEEDVASAAPDTCDKDTFLRDQLRSESIV